MSISNFIRSQLSPVVGQIVLNVIDTHEGDEAPSITLPIDENTTLGGDLYYPYPAGSRRSLTQSERSLQGRSCILFFCPNAALVSNMYMSSYLRNLAECTQSVVIAYDYRSAGYSSGKATTFQNFIDDGSAIVNNLIVQGVDPRQLTIHGVSLGGAVATQVAARFQEPNREVNCIVVDTFSSLEDVAIGIPRETVQAFSRQSNDTICGRAICALKDMLLSPLRLAIRVTYFFIQTLIHLAYGEFNEAGETLTDLGKSALFCTLLTLTGFIALIAAPFTTRVHEFNLVCHKQLTPQNPLTYANHHPITRKIIKITLNLSGWNDVDNVAAWERIRGRKMACYAPNDWLISYRYGGSLVRRLEERLNERERGNIYKAPDDAGHASHFNSGHAILEIRNFLRARA